MSKRKKKRGGGRSPYEGYETEVWGSSPIQIAAIENVKLYRIVSAREVSPKSGMTKGEETACTDIAAVLAEKFGQYIAGSRKAAAR